MVKKFGITLEKRSFRDLGLRAKAISDAEAESARKGWELPVDGVLPRSLNSSTKLYLAVKADLVEERNVRAIGINCLNESHFSDTTPCLAWNRLFMESGIIWGCEGDSVSMGNRAKGWELEFYGSPIAKMTMTGGYSLMDTSLTDATAIVKNPELPGVPRHKLMTFISYDLRGNSRDGLRLKGGMTYQTSMIGRASNNYRMPGGFLIDLGADYTFGRWNLALNVNNVTDKILPSFGIAQSSNNVYPPRNILLSLRRQL